MSETGAKRRLPLAEASALAGELVGLLRPACRRVVIAGSIRRGKADVGDIEIVAEPLIDWAPIGLFGDLRPVNGLDNFCDELVETGTLSRRLDADGRGRYGPRHKALLYSGFGVDLFSVIAPGQWGVIFAIRTGPAEWSHRLVTDRRRGGMCPPWATFRNGGVYHANGTLMETPEESDLFRVLGLEWVPPGARA